MVIFCNFMVKLYLNNGLIALLIFPLRIGIIKSRFHYVRHQNLIFHDFLIFEVLEPRIYGLYYAKILQKILESIWEHPGKILSLEI